MKNIFLLLLCIPLAVTAQNKTDFTTVFEKSNGLESATYQQTITFTQNWYR